MTGRFEIGRYELASAVSRPGFLRTGVTKASLNIAYHTRTKSICPAQCQSSEHFFKILQTNRRTPTCIAPSSSLLEIARYRRIFAKLDTEFQHARGENDSFFAEMCKTVSMVAQVYFGALFSRHRRTIAKKRKFEI